MAAADEFLDRAIAEWVKGEFYEAHELLEEVAEALEDSDADHRIALALTRAAACLHKLANDVGVNAVPAKLEGVLEDLEGAPPGWRRTNLGELRDALRALHSKLAGTKHFTPEELPKLRRA